MKASSLGTVVLGVRFDFGRLTVVVGLPGRVVVGPGRVVDGLVDEVGVDVVAGVVVATPGSAVTVVVVVAASAGGGAAGGTTAFVVVFTESGVPGFGVVPGPGGTGNFGSTFVVVVVVI